MKALTVTQIKNLYMSIFPHSHISASNACLGGNEIYFNCYLQDPTQWANKISNNDPLNYRFTYNPVTKVYSENAHSFTVKPTETWLCYSSVKLRKKTIKNCNPEKLLKRFNQFKQLIIDNLDNAAHDIADKVK